MKKRTLNEFNRDIINKYQDETGKSVLDMNKVAEWAINEGLWEPKPVNIVSQCAKDLTRAARQEYFTDEKGRRVHKKYSIRTEQGFFWADVDLAQPDFMKMSLQQRRGYIVYDCAQLKNDLDSYNENNIHGVEIQLCFDFTPDVNENLMPEEYPDSRPEEDEEKN